MPLSVGRLTGNIQRYAPSSGFQPAFLQFQMMGPYLARVVVTEIKRSLLHRIETSRFGGTARGVLELSDSVSAIRQRVAGLFDVTQVARDVLRFGIAKAGFPYPALLTNVLLGSATLSQVASAATNRRASAEAQQVLSRQLQERLARNVARRLPKDTGRLRRSITVANASPNLVQLRGAFYGAFAAPKPITGIIREELQKIQPILASQARVGFNRTIEG